MFNLLIAWGAGIAAWAILALPRLLRPGEAAVPAVVLALATFVILARRAARRVQVVVGRATSALQNMPPRFDQAVRELSRGYPLARWQFGIRSQLDAQIGMICFIQREFGRAMAPLKRSYVFAPWVAGAMLAVLHYRKKDHDAARKVYQVVLRKGRKHALCWCLWAYLLCQMNDRAGAQRLLAEGTAKLPNDVRLRESLLALQNGKKLKMRAFGEQWYQFHLERPPAQAAVAAGGARPRATMRRGRW